MMDPTTTRDGEILSPYYDWSPIVDRPPLVWPDQARIAFGVVLSLESMGWHPPKGAVIPPQLRTGRGYPRVPNLHDVSQYEYGNRVGVYRILSLLDQHGIRATIAMDTVVAERSAFLVDYLRERNAEFVGHGLSADRMVTQAMSEADEREYLGSTLAETERLTGRRPRGWLGSAYGESARTVGLLAELGVEYVCDWPTDEQPHLMNVARGRMVNLPVMVELDDVVTHLGRAVPIHRFTRMMTEQFDRMYDDAASTGRLFLLHLHPWLMGHPFRIKYLAEALQHIASRPGVWRATGSEIVDAFLATGP
jgi:peptidoglycan/xylan/chitin deacetylase (PgdA/CDA1 family)